MSEDVDSSVIAREVDSWGAATLRDAERTLANFRVLVDATIKLTYPEDWVIHEGRDGRRLCYLQASGASRIAGPWGINFEKVNLLADCELTDIGDPDGNIAWEVNVRAGSKQTDQVVDELGYRGSADPFFAAQWKKAKNDPAERFRLRAYIRKAAIQNARGRALRSLTGMMNMPAQRLVETGMDMSRCAGVTYKSGSQGGAPADGDGAPVITQPQAKKIAGIACYDGKVKGWTKSDYGNAMRILDEAKDLGLSQARASQIIEGFGGMEKGGMLPELFIKTVMKGLKRPEPAPAEPKEPDPQAGQGTEPAQKTIREMFPACPACERTWEIVDSNGHAPGCPEGGA